MNIIITGGLGFIGSNFLNMHVPEYPEHTFINIDKPTYAALGWQQVEYFATGIRKTIKWYLQNQECIAGVSRGVDSSWALVKTVDLYTHVLDRNEYRSLLQTSLF